MTTSQNKSRGVVLLLTLCGMTLLVAIVFVVYTLSDQVNRKIELQNSADSTAISSAGWYARSMNLVAQNNVTQARLLALVAVMDSIPLAAEMTVAELSTQGEDDNLTDGLQQQLARGVPSTNLERGDFLQNGLEKLYEKMSDEDLTPLIQLDQAFDTPDERQTEGQYDITRLTTWSNNDYDESLWQVASSLHAQSQAAIESVNSLAQNTAYSFATANNSESGYAIPVDLPKFRNDTTFDHFSPVLLDRIGVIQADSTSDPAVSHQLRDIVNTLRTAADPVMTLENQSLSRNYGGAIPDFAYPHRLGPWANLYRWRVNQYQGEGGESYGASDPEMGRGSTGRQYHKIGYLTYGPVSWAIGHLVNRLGLPAYRAGTMNSTRFVHHLGKLSQLKLAYMFGLESPQNVQYADRWITNYVSARNFAAVPENREKIIRTRYYRVVVMSSVSWNSNQWLADSSTYYTRTPITPFDSPPSTRWVWDRGGWYDIAEDRYRRSNGTFTKPKDHIWVWKRSAETEYDPRINMQRQYDDEGNPLLQPVYYCSWYVFGGIEIRDEQPVHNPCDWASTNDLPRPILLDVSELRGWGVENDGQDGVKVRGYSLVGVARADNTAALWTSQFSSANPDNAMTAFARAEVFNSKSWDMWTQDWRVKLVPVLNKSNDSNDHLTEWSDLVNKADDALAEIPEYQTEVPLSTLEDVLEYIKALNHGGMTDDFVNH